MRACTTFNCFCSPKDCTINIELEEKRKMDIDLSDLTSDLLVDVESDRYIPVELSVDNQTDLNVDIFADDRLDVCLKDLLITKSIVRYSNYEDLPKTGSPNLLYVVDNREIYLWDVAAAAYILVNASISNVGNGRITIVNNGKEVTSFTVNQAADAEINMQTPTKVSELENDVDYISDMDIETLNIDFSDYF